MLRQRRRPGQHARDRRRGRAPSKYDTPTYAAVGYPAFGTSTARRSTSLPRRPGLFRALDVAAPEYQGGQDFIGAWQPRSTGQFVPGYPAPVNDLQFLTGPVVGNVVGRRGKAQQVIGGTSSLDLEAFGASGAPASAAWPKLTGDWTAATPALGLVRHARHLARGSQGRRLDHPLGDAVRVSDAGRAPARRAPRPASTTTTPIRATTRATRPARAADEGPAHRSHRRGWTLRFIAPGGDLLCGSADSYQLVTSRQPITAQSFASGTPDHRQLVPAAGGSTQALKLPRGVYGYVAIRAVERPETGTADRSQGSEMRCLYSSAHATGCV